MIMSTTMTSPQDAATTVTLPADVLRVEEGAVLVKLRTGFGDQQVWVAAKHVADLAVAPPRDRP